MQLPDGRQVLTRPALPATGTVPAGRQGRCASDIHADRPAVAWGTFVSPKGETTPDVGYCGDCAHVLNLVGWFQPDSNETPRKE